MHGFFRASSQVPKSVYIPNVQHALVEGAMCSIWSFEELQRWLDDEYPDLRVFQWPSGRWSIEQEFPEVVVYELDFSYAYDGIAYKEIGWQPVIEARNRMVGSWVCDELRRRDPRGAHNPHNLFHQAYLLSKKAEAEHEQNNKSAQDSARASWDIVSRSPALLNRIAAHMDRGDTNAAMKELSLEELYRNALKENPKELRSKDFWRSVKNGS